MAQEKWEVLQQQYPTPLTGGKYLWAYPLSAKVLRNTQGTEAAIDYLAQPLPTDCDTPGESGHRRYYPPVLSDLAALQESLGRTDDARDTLQRFDALWSSPDAEVSTVAQVEDLRLRLVQPETPVLAPE